MKKLHIVTIAALAALSSGGVYAHGDESHPMKKPAFDASKVEERAFGREGDPKKVTRTIKVDMTGHDALHAGP
jgi:hypothetical protein